MLLKQALSSHLIGTIEEVDGRVYPIGSVPDAAVYPFITYQKISNIRTRHQLGSSGLAETRVQLDIWARHTDAESGTVIAERVAENIRQALNSFRGKMGVRGRWLRVPSVFLDAIRDEFTHDARRGVCRISMDFMVWHGELAIDKAPLPAVDESAVPALAWADHTGDAITDHTGDILIFAE